VTLYYTVIDWASGQQLFYNEKKKKYHTVGKIDITRTHSWLGTGTSIRSGGIN
jgi:hypothetical protein